MLIPPHPKSILEPARYYNRKNSSLRMNMQEQPGASINSVIH